MKSIPCQIIAGPLGIGKTTTLLAYLKRQQGRERIAILVNDFGTLGIDGTLLNANPGSPESPRIVSVPGGCLCCTASIYFESDESSTAPASTHPAHTAHHSQLQRGAWEAPPDAIMDPASLIDWLEKAAAAENHFGLLRLKGMIFTARGWMEIQWTEEGFDTRPFAPQNIQRLEWIMQADGDVDHVTGLLARQGNVLSAGEVGMYRRNSEC